MCQPRSFISAWPTTVRTIIVLPLCTFFTQNTLQEKCVDESVTRLLLFAIWLCWDVMFTSVWRGPLISHGPSDTYVASPITIKKISMCDILEACG